MAERTPGGPRSVDRLIVHRWDAARPLPGGIDTCLRGICRYARADVTLAVVGVDACGDPTRALGRWELHTFGERQVWFMPVTRMEGLSQVRRVPHALQVALGATRYRRRIPRSRIVQVHRMDMALYAFSSFRRPLAYFVHTQEGGLVGENSDSFWRHVGGAHGTLERRVVQRAEKVVVFNDDYARQVQQWNANTMASPTWYDPALFGPAEQRDPYQVVWVGRLEVPKDPLLALHSFRALVAADAANPWRLTLVGEGRIEEQVRAALAALPADVAGRVTLAGRRPPEDVAELMGRGGIFLMTSHAGYEGYPRVLVEAIASGLVPVVTEGADTGGLVTAEVGFVCGRDPAGIADAMRRTPGISREVVLKAAEPLRADLIVARILAPGTPSP